MDLFRIAEQLKDKSQHPNITDGFGILRQEKTPQTHISDIEPQYDNFHNKSFRLTSTHSRFPSPCSICGGQQYRYHINGSLHCAQCEPKVLKQKVIALGETKKQGDRDKSSCRGLFQHSVKYGQRNHSTAEECFRVGFQWVSGNLSELIQRGWTRPEIYRRGCLRWPVGNWGLAWLPIWARSEIIVSIGQRGKIIFSFKVCDRIITQSATPRRIQCGM